MIKTILLIILCLNLFAFDISAEGSLTIQLIFAKEGYSKDTPRPLTKPEEIFGGLIIDISPYPDTIEKDRYLVEYFLDDTLLYQTTGFDEASQSVFSFKYILDTTKFENGSYKLIVNFWDKDGPSAIGIKEVIVNNKNE